MRAFTTVSRMIAPYVLAVVLLAGTALADQRVTWDFVIETEGQDVYWTSPTAVSNTADCYDMSYEITQLVVTVRYLFFEFDVDVTNQIPPEHLSGSDIFAGPPPIVLYEGEIRYPEPPEPVGFAAHVAISLDAAGFGQIAVTDVILGEIEVYLEPYGTITVELLAIHMEGLFTVVPLSHQAGDLNCDCLIDAFDIDPFVLALTDPAGYAAAWPDCDHMLADCNGDGVVDAFDIDPFVELLTGE